MSATICLMSDDQQPGGPPPQPNARPVFLPPGSGIAAPTAASGEPGGSATAPSGADLWPAYLGVLAFFGGLAAMILVLGVFALIYFAAGGGEDDPGLIVVATVIQGVVFAVTAVALARTTGPVSARDFGLVRARLWP